MSEGEQILIADLILGVDIDQPAQALIDRAVQDIQNRTNRTRLKIQAELDSVPVMERSVALREEIKKQAAEGAKANREAITAARALKAEREAEISTLKAQSAQVQLTARLSNQAEREALSATRSAMQARREAIDALRLDYSRLRTALDTMKISETQFNQGGDQIIRKLKAMGDSAEFTTRELKQLSDLEGRIGREQNSVAGIVNPAGLSGNVAVGMRSALPGILAGLQQVTQMSPSLGAAAAQVTGIVQGLSEVKIAAQGAAPHTLQLAQGMNTSATAAGILRGGASGAGGAVTGLGGAAVATGAALGALTIVVTAGAAAASKAVNEYAKLEYSIAQVSTLTNQTPAQMQAVGREVLNISRNLGMSYQDIAAGLYDVLGAGVKGTEDLNAALEFTEEAAKLAIAGATTTATATDVLTSAMNAYKLSATDTQMVADSLFQAVKDGKMTFNDLAGSLGMVTAIAADADVPLQTVLAALATMTANGVKASSAVDYLRGLIKAIVAPGEEAAKAFDALGIAYGDNALKSKGLVGVLQEIVQKTGGSTEKMVELLGGIEAVTAATSISSGEFDRMKANLDSQAKSAGAAADAYGKMADTLQKENDRLDANWKSLWANLGTYFAPFKTDVLDFLNDALEKLNLFIQRSTVARGLNNAGQDVINLQNQLKVQQDSRQNAYARLRDPNVDAEEKARIRADFLPKILAEIDRLKAEIAAAQAVLTATRAAAYGPQQGPALPGQSSASAADYGGPDTNSSEFQSKVAQQALLKTGVRTADAVVDYCAQWVRLTLGRADKAAAATVNKYFQADANGDGRTTANDAAQNLRAAGLMKQYKSTKDLKPGDLVFYEDGGAGHVGIYIGGGLVQGNNRITYRENGGPVDAKGNPTDFSGRYNAVGKVAIDRLGQVTGYARPDDVAGFVPKSTTGTPPPAQNVQVTAALIIRAQQLLDKVEVAQKAAQAKPGDPALKVAYNTATKELEAWTKANEANADALAAVRATQEKAARTTGQYIATQADLKKYGNDALRLYKALETAQLTGSSAAVTAAERNIATWQGENKARKAVYDAEMAAYKIRQGIEATATQNRLKTQQDLQDALAQGREKDARRALQTLKDQQAAEIALAQNSAAKRAQIIAQTGPAIIAAEDKLAELKRRAAVAANQRAYDQAAKLPGADLVALRATQKALNLQAYQTERDEREAARTQQAAAERAANQTALQAQQQHERERKAILHKNAEEGRNLTVSAAEQRLKEIKGINERELASFKGTAEERLRIIKRQSQAEYQAAVDLANAQKIVALQRSANEGGPNRAERDRQIREAYTLTVAELGASRATTVQTEVDREKNAVQELRDEYSRLAEGLREKITAGTVTQEDLTEYWQSIVTIGKAAQDAGVSGNKFLQSAQLGAKGVHALAQGVIDAGNRLREFREEFDRTSDEVAAAADVALDDRNTDDVAEVARLKKLGAGMMLNFLGGPGNDNFGDKFWTRFGEEGRAEFMTALNSFDADDFAKLPKSLLEAWAAQMGDDAQWAGVKAQVLSAIGKITDDVGRLADAKIEGQLKALDLQRANETITEDDYQAQRTALLTTQETERWAREKKALEAKGYKAGDTLYELAYQDHQNRLTDIAIGGVKKRVEAEKEGQEETASILDARRNPVQSIQDDIDNITALFDEGQLTAAEYSASLDVAAEGLDTMAAEAERLGNHRLAQQFRDAAKATRELNPELAKARAELEKLVNGTQKFTAGLSSIFKGLGMNDFATIADGIGTVVTEVSKLPAQLKDAEQAWKSFKSAQSMGTLGDLLGSVGGLLGTVGTVINVFGQIGDAVLNMVPGFQEWRKSLLEVAEAQKAVLGRGSGGFTSPWAEALKQDAASRDQLANAGFWQRAAWWLFGGAPEVMKTESAKMLTALQEIFADVGSGLANLWTGTMEAAFSAGDMSQWALNFDKTFDQMVGKVIVKTMVEAAIESGAVAADLGELSKAIHEQRYADIPPILERIKVNSKAALAPIAAVAPSLPGYGQGDSGGPGGASRAFGAAPGMQIGAPRFEIRFPESVGRGFDKFEGTVLVLDTASHRLIEAAELIIASQRRGGVPQPSGRSVMT